jgi:hypothetical protein
MPVDRDYYKSDCDDRNKIGYRLMLADPTAIERYENMSTFKKQTLNNAFTVWVRKPLQVSDDGLYIDEPRNDLLVIVAKSVAPYAYTTNFAGETDALRRSRQAVRVLETRLTLALNTAGNPCGLGRMQGQEEARP